MEQPRATSIVALVLHTRSDGHNNLVVGHIVLVVSIAVWNLVVVAYIASKYILVRLVSVKV